MTWKYTRSSSRMALAGHRLFLSAGLDTVGTRGSKSPSYYATVFGKHLGQFSTMAMAQSAAVRDARETLRAALLGLPPRNIGEAPLDVPILVFAVGGGEGRWVMGRCLEDPEGRFFIADGLMGDWKITRWELLPG